MLFYKTNKKRIFLALVISLILCFLLALISVKIKDIPVYSFPKGYTYLDGENINEIKKELNSDGISFDVISKLSFEKESVPVYNPYDVDYNLDIASLDYSKDASDSVVTGVKDLLNHQVKIISYKLAYLKLPDNLVDEMKINIPLYNISDLLVGHFPKQGEVLIDETLANKLLSDSGNKRYKDLIGKSYKINLKDCEDIYCEKDSFKISGVYKSEEILKNQNIIVNPKTKAYDYLKEGDALLFKEEDQDIDSSDGSFSLDYLNTLNYTYIRNVIIILIGIVVFTLLIYKDLKRWFYISSYYNVLFFKHLSVLYLYIVLILIILMFLQI